MGKSAIAPDRFCRETRDSSHGPMTVLRQRTIPLFVCHAWASEADFRPRSRHKKDRDNGKRMRLGFGNAGRKPSWQRESQRVMILNRAAWPPAREMRLWPKVSIRMDPQNPKMTHQGIARRTFLAGSAAAAASTGGSRAAGTRCARRPSRSPRAR